MTVRKNHRQRKARCYFAHHGWSNCT
jgi:hypothetical protein